MRAFLPWTSPLLPAVAARMIADCAAAAPDSRDADFSEWLLVVRGRAAGRRLLALLAAEAQRAGRALVPPRIVTPSAMDAALFAPGPEVAGAAARRLAWMLAVQRAPDGLLGKIWESPEWQDPRSRAFSLGGVLDRTWRELSTTGAGFSEILSVLEHTAPDVVELDRERWVAMENLLRDYRKILRAWNLADPADERARFAKSGETNPRLRVALVGVVELAPLLVALLRRLPDGPLVFVHAPESESAGFDEWGRLIFSHWEKSPCAFENGELHIVRGVKEQADRCAELIAQWQRSGTPPSAVTIAVPEPEALPALLHGLADAGIEARAAEGNPASRTTVFRLLSCAADFLDRPKGEPPDYASVAALARHPDLARVARCPVEKLDTYFGEHLPARLKPFTNEPASTAGRVTAMLARFEKLLRIRSASFVEDVTDLVLRIYGAQQMSSRSVLRSLEAVRDFLDELKVLPQSALEDLTVADLLRLVVESAREEKIPEPENPDAVEVAGWLEAAADDAPALIVTSVFEGSLPEGAGTEPLLVDRVRQELGLPCRASRHARDQYTLHTVWMSRRQSGRFALLAPRRTAAGVPARPSRLLLAAHEGPALARRLLAVTSDTHSIAPMAKGGPGHTPPEPDPELMRAYRKFRVTGFSTYIASPLLFYFKHILALGAQDDSAEELDAGMFGTAIHSVLQVFGERRLGKTYSPAASAIVREVNEILDAHMSRRFGPHALPTARAQHRALQARLGIFAERQAAQFADGWQIAFVESRSALEVDFPVAGAPSGVKLRGKIDRIDRHRDGAWRVMDYKSSARAKQPDEAHFAKRSGEWRDLQLPLYVKLLRSVGIPELDAAEKLDLVYFNLPPKADDAGITDPFDLTKVEDAWRKAEEIVTEVCSGCGCREVGEVYPNEDPAFLALCGQNGLPTISSED